MAKEIEKKYLVVRSKLPKLKSGREYLQGYLSFSPLIRFRIADDKVYLNVKSVKQDNIAREEFEFFGKLDRREIKELKKIAISKPIQKVRYQVKYKGKVWEVDVYQGDNKGLITAELEMPNENYKPNFPDWVDRGQDITNDEKYFNRNLGDHPYKELKK